MSERIGREVLQLPCVQKDGVGQASERLKASSPDNDGLNLAVDVFSHGIAAAEPIGRKNARQVGFHGFSQAFEGFQPTSSEHRDSGAKQRLWIFAGPALLMNLLVALLHAPGPGGLQTVALEPVHVSDLQRRIETQG